MGVTCANCGLQAERRSQKVGPKRWGLEKLTWLGARLVWTGMWAPAQLPKSDFQVSVLVSLTTRETNAAMGVQGSEIKHLGAKMWWAWMWKVSDNGQGTRNILSPGQEGSGKGNV